MSVLPPEGPYDCKSCGACCIEAGKVQIKPTDPKNPYSVQSDDMFVMDRYMGGRCKALEGVIGSCVSCNIYTERPQVCREFEPGSSGCRYSREVASRKITKTDWRPRGYGENWQETV
jgi:uncharacterized protein